MTLSVLEICTEALEEIGIDPPSGLVAGGDLGRQLLGIANSIGRNIALRGNWEELKTEGAFTTLATELQTDLKTDFPYIRKILTNTLWNRSRQERLVGPLSAQAWHRIKSDGFDPVYPSYYMRGSKIYFPGTPTAGEEVYFEWLDKRWCSTSDGVTLKERCTLDNDIPRLDDHAMVLGVRWRFLQKKGLEYGEAFREFEDWVSERLGSNEPSETLSLNPRGNPGIGGDLVWDENSTTWNVMP